ncbi:Aspartic protease [Phytophthora megakarya]|uniref:Aspartic protease n=1 Tax=Phytophthora megakarya TaxID=4795 RepID=A0A225UHS0_9STRA|nr:Aspartic protease [Phytophthora megakarya]
MIPSPVVWISLCAQRSIHLRPGQDAILRIRYGQSNPQRELVWAGREKSWVTKVLYSARSWATAVKVVNVSDQNVWIETRTPVVRIVEYGQFPGQPGFVRPGKARYEEWQQLFHECTVSRQARMRAEWLEQIIREREPPCTQTQRCQWPTKLLMRPQSQVAEGKMVKLQEKPKPLDMTLKVIGTSAAVMSTVARDPEEPETRPEPVEQTHPDSSPEVETLDPESMADVEEDAQLRDQLIMLSEIEERTPECNIDEANVGVPGVATPEMEAKMRGILKRHRSIFLGDGNAAPDPAKGVVSDIDVGEAKPVALRARQIAAPFLVKVFELLKKLLEESSLSIQSPSGHHLL